MSSRDVTHDAPRQRDASSASVANPYLEEFERRGCGTSFDDELLRGPGGIGSLFETREELVRSYAWAVPNAAALAAIAARGPVVEIGAGLGYWARLLLDLGCHVAPYDTLLPGDEHWTKAWRRAAPFAPVRRGGPEAAAAHPDRALLLCWPPYWDTVASAALAAYTGSTVCYVGEGVGGCTADDPFFHALEHDWDLVETVAIPSWHWIHDDLTIYTRKTNAR